MKKEGKKWMLVALALLAVVTVALPLVGCKNDSVAEQTGDNTEQPAAPGTGDQGSGDGNQGTGDQGTGDGNQGTGDGTGSGSGNQGSGDPEQPVTYTVSFNTNGGGYIDSQTIVSGQTATKPTDPTLEDNVFDGWYSDAKFSKPYDFTTPVKGSFTLHAKWVEGTEVTANNVSTVIKGLTGEEPHTLVVTGELKDLSAIKTALQVNSTAKVNLDLSKATGLTTIGDSAFRGCSGLTSISIPEDVKSIEYAAFSECSGLTSIDLSKATGLTSIREAAFQGCSGLTSINIPEGVTTIIARAFIGCSSLYIRVNGNNTKYSSVDGMLLNKEKTTLIAYPSAKETVTNVPTSVTTIMRAAFEDCNSLTSISIPSSVTSIRDEAFIGCSSLEEVTMEANTPPTLGFWAFNGTAGNLQILVPSSSVNDYKAANNWKDLTIEAIPEPTS